MMVCIYCCVQLPRHGHDISRGAMNKHDATGYDMKCQPLRDMTYPVMTWRGMTCPVMTSCIWHDRAQQVLSCDSCTAAHLNCMPLRHESWYPQAQYESLTLLSSIDVETDNRTSKENVKPSSLWDSYALHWEIRYSQRPGTTGTLFSPALLLQHWTPVYLIPVSVVQSHSKTQGQNKLQFRRYCGSIFPLMLT